MQRRRISLYLTILLILLAECVCLAKTCAAMGTDHYPIGSRQSIVSIVQAESLKHSGPSAQQVKDLQPIKADGVTVRLNEHLRIIYATIGKLYGIDVVVDSQVRDRTLLFECQNATFEEILDDLSASTNTIWKPASSKTIIIQNRPPVVSK
jgi:hypothetical protein